MFVPSLFTKLHKIKNGVTKKMFQSMFVVLQQRNHKKSTLSFFIFHVYSMTRVYFKNFFLQIIPLLSNWIDFRIVLVRHQLHQSLITTLTVVKIFFFVRFTVHRGVVLVCFNVFNSVFLHNWYNMTVTKYINDIINII